MKVNWREVVSRHHEWAHRDDDCVLLMPDPSDEKRLVDKLGSLGFPRVEEFESFYRSVDGYGSKWNVDDEDSWLFVPVDQLPTAVKHGRDWFLKTHPDIAERFFAFINWGNGDYSGYLLDETGGCDGRIYTFEHEMFEFDEKQDWRDFLDSYYDSILDFLSMSLDES